MYIFNRFRAAVTCLKAPDANSLFPPDTEIFFHLSHSSVAERMSSATQNQPYSLFLFQPAQAIRSAVWPDRARAANHQHNRPALSARRSLAAAARAGRTRGGREQWPELQPPELFHCEVQLSEQPHLAWLSSGGGGFSCSCLFSL